MVVKITDTLVDGVDVSAHAAALDAHIYSFMQKMRTGEYFAPWPFVGDYTARVLTLSTDRIYALPFCVARDLTIDRLAIDVTTADAGKIARLGIYNDGTNLYPGTLVVDAGTVSVADVAVVAATIDQALTKGVYWLVVVSDGAPELQAFLIMCSPIGIRAADLSANVDSNCYWFKAGVGVGALDDPFVADAALTYGYCPMVAPRLASLD